MLSESAFVIVMIMLSIASLLALLTLDISHSSTCHVSTATILTVCSVVFPPESWIPILKLLPALEALALNLIVSLSDKSIGWPTVRVNAARRRRDSDTRQKIYHRQGLSSLRDYHR